MNYVCPYQKPDRKGGQVVIWLPKKARFASEQLVESRFIGTDVAKPKARLCEPWEIMAALISGVREAGDI